MGQKVHPLGLRIGITQKHRSNWFANAKTYPRYILEDQLIRGYILKKYLSASIVDIRITRQLTTQDIETKEKVDVVEISIHSALPSKILDSTKAENSLNELKIEIEKLCQKERLKQNLPTIQVILTIFKIDNLYSEASVIADYLIKQLEERVPFRSALKKSLKQTRFAKLKGIKIQIAGRLNGAEIARTEWVRKGRVPLQTLKADIDYSYKTAKTIYGILGIKIWIFKGENDL